MDCPMKNFTTTSTQTTYEVNGVRYQRLEDIPQEFRKFFEDRDGNGIPDFIESFSEGSKSVMRIAQHRFDRKTLVDSDLGRALEPFDLHDHDQPATLRCSSCGFDLREAKIGGQCPECGQQVTRTIRQQSLGSNSSRCLDFLYEHPGLIGTLVIIVIAVVYLIYALRSVVF
jgi:predicted RNA-binding Zn-ribbon protein involved in translation (DUF1610 family)